VGTPAAKGKAAARAHANSDDDMDTLGGDAQEDDDSAESAQLRAVDAVRIWALDQLALLVRSSSLLHSNSGDATSDGVGRFVLKFLLVHGHFPTDASTFTAVKQTQPAGASKAGKAKGKKSADHASSDDASNNKIEAELSALIVAPTPEPSDRVKAACSVRLFAALKDLLAAASNPRRSTIVIGDSAPLSAATAHLDPSMWAYVLLV
jgi:hypothetical protein